jgi:hypothetical protein
MDKHHDTKTALQSLLCIVTAALAAASITWLTGLLFGPVSDARARQLAAGMAAPGLALARTEGASLDRRSAAASAPSTSGA